MKFDESALRLYAVTDRMWTGQQTLCEQVEQALLGGVTCVQLREKTLTDDAFLEEAIAINSLCHKYHVPFIINDNVEIALKCKADGIHVGQEDMTAANVRSVVGKDMLIGVSVHTVEEALSAQRNGADYLGVGAMFSTATKADAEVVSIQMLCDICKSVSIPVVAIGGLNKENIIGLKDTGINGVALVSAIFAADDIKSECAELKKICQCFKKE